jgi:hypothetical protein
MSTMPPRRPHPDPGLSPSEWHTQELLLMREVMRGIGRSLAPALVLREMLHLMSELLGLNRGRIVLADPAPGHKSQPRTACIQHAYGLTQAEVARGRYAWGEGITGRVLATGQPAIVQDIDAEPLFLFRAVERSHLPPVTVAFIALPIEVNNVPIGVLACHRIRSRQRHLNDDLAVLACDGHTGRSVAAAEELVAEQTRRLEARNAVLAQALNTNSARYGLIGNSPPLLQALGELERKCHRLPPRCCCWASRAPARSCSRAPCTWPARGATSPSSRSTARPFRMPCSSPSCSATSAAPSPGLARRAPAGSNRRMAARSSWTRSANCHSRCNPSCCAPCRKARWCAWVANRKCA